MKRAKRRTTRASEHDRMLDELLETGKGLHGHGAMSDGAVLELRRVWANGKREFAAMGGYDTPDEVISERLASWDAYLMSGRVAPRDFKDGVTDLPNAADTDENL